MTETHLVSTPITGRFLVDPSPRPGAPLLVGFHGYAQRAEDLLEDLGRIPGCEAWTRVSVQALHAFYRPRTQDVVASWMTRQDRGLAIADNLAYVRRVAGELRASRGGGKLVFAGFSQGAAMAWRAAAHCGPCHGLIALGGDLPPDVPKAPALVLPPMLLGRGLEDMVYPEAQFASDLATLEGLGFHPEAVRFPGGHAWGPGFLEAAGRFLEGILRP